MITFHQASSLGALDDDLDSRAYDASAGVAAGVAAMAVEQLMAGLDIEPTEQVLLASLADGVDRYVQPPSGSPLRPAVRALAATAISARLEADGRPIEEEEQAAAEISKLLKTVAEEGKSARRDDMDRLRSLLVATAEEINRRLRRPMEVLVTKDPPRMAA
jgi:hypothetical protein